MGLFALFMLPIGTALVLNVAAPGWLPFGQANLGTLVQPPLRAGLAAVQPLDGGPLPGTDLEAVWTLVHVSTGGCDSACRDALVKMRQARLALGKDARRLARWWLVTETADARTVSRIRDEHPGLRRGLLAGDAGLGRDAGQVQLVDPAGLLILRYAQDDSASAILKDLKRLLRISKQG